MKKLKLKAFGLEGAEVLTRDQLKKVFGGLRDDSGGSGEGCIVDGESCGIFTFCCNECHATFKCGPVTAN